MRRLGDEEKDREMIERKEREILKGCLIEGLLNGGETSWISFF